MTTDHPTEGMITLRHVAGSSGKAYDRIYAGTGIRHDDRFSNWALRRIAARPGMHLLDVACGEGQLVRAADDQGLRARGVDLSREALRTAARAGAHESLFAAADGEALPFGDDSFDRVTNMGSLEHYQNPVAGAAEMARVCKPEGLVALHVPNTYGLRWAVQHAWRSGEVHDDGQPIQRYGTRGQWTRLLESAGLRVLSVDGYEDLQHAPRAVLDYLMVLGHPSRLLVPLSRFLPTDMASMLFFLCRPYPRSDES